MANTVRLDRYTVEATAACTEGGGQVVVFHNDSSHFFVGLRVSPDDQEVIVYETYCYADVDPRAEESNTSFVYARALVKMTELALQF